MVTCMPFFLGLFQLRNTINNRTWFIWLLCPSLENIPVDTDHWLSG